MRITILTLFPEMFQGPFDSSIVHRAIGEKKATLDFVNIRDFATDTHKSVDDHPYGGGPGMILKVDIIDKALKKVRSKTEKGKRNERVILLDPGGEQYTQAKARVYSKLAHLILICGHYEGIDERVRLLVDESISIGNYVLTGGEIPAMVIIDSIVRLIPGVLKKPESALMESFSDKSPGQPYLEYPQYTRPQVYNRHHVPSILLSGDHKKIAQWQELQSLKRSQKK